MPKDNPVLRKSYSFAVKSVSIARVLRVKKEFELGSQLLRSGTSIGANVEEAVQAQSRKDFVSKLSIALKESYEARYWLRLCLDTSMLTKIEVGDAMQELQEVISLLTSIIKTTRQSL
jgi:four helix bundle protein